MSSLLLSDQKYSWTDWWQKVVMSLKVWSGCAHWTTSIHQWAYQELWDSILDQNRFNLTIKLQLLQNIMGEPCGLRKKASGVILYHNKFLNALLVQELEIPRGSRRNPNSKFKFVVSSNVLNTRQTNTCRLIFTGVNQNQYVDRHLLLVLIWTKAYCPIGVKKSGHDFNSLFFCHPPLYHPFSLHITLTSSFNQLTDTTLSPHHCYSLASMSPPATSPLRQFTSSIEHCWFLLQYASSSSLLLLSLFLFGLCQQVLCWCTICQLTSMYKFILVLPMAGMGLDQNL